MKCSRQRNRRGLESALWVLSLGFLVGMGCQVELSSNPGQDCVDNEGCGEGEICYRGFCTLNNRCATDGATAECYDGPENTLDHGVCHAGERMCNDGEWSACLAQITPGVESCNTEDDDCDDVVDEVDASCETGRDGVCGVGQLMCDAGAARCMGTVEATTEVCNGLDDNCDGDTDEYTSMVCYPEDAAGCVANEDGGFDCLGSCQVGIQTCDEGELGECEGAVVPAAEDGCTPEGETAIDDDCNGETDEDCPCDDGAMQSCYGGPLETAGVGSCVAGEQTCVGTTWGPCQGQVIPTAESCANEGEDDDCDGVDDDIIGVGESCAVDGAMGACRLGTRGCVGDALGCDTPEPTDEVCNGVDDNCDGSIDETFDFASDEANCGACDEACGAEQTCCDNDCVDLQTDEMHCSECGENCGGGLTCCTANCADLATDEANCGSCGFTCTAGTTCCGGSGCFNLQTNAMRCGSCNQACPGGQICSSGHCCPSGQTWTGGASGGCCPTGLTYCSGSCVNTSESASHCGECGQACVLPCTCSGGECALLGVLCD